LIDGVTERLATYRGRIEAHLRNDQIAVPS